MLLGVAAATERHSYRDISRFTGKFDAIDDEDIPVPKSMERWRTEFHHDLDDVEQQEQRPIQAPTAHTQTRQHTRHTRRAFPEVLGDKNPETRELTWSEYELNRPHEHDCHINERFNWYGNHRCRFSWECTGARNCEKHVHGHPGTQGIGWCRGPSACPLLGPLDSYKEQQQSHPENPDDGIKWNRGTPRRRDLDEWEERL